MKELVIIGSGPAGLTAAIYAKRAGLDFVLYDQDGYGGGQIASAHEVQNFPGLGTLSGEALSEAFLEHAGSLGVSVEFGEITSVEQTEDGFLVKTSDGDDIACKTVISATGAHPARLGIPGEEQFSGRGVSYCAICDGAFYKDKHVLVVGGGDTAVEDALYLSTICSKVTIIIRRDVFRAAASRAELLKSQANVEVLYHTNLIEIKGDKDAERFILEQNGEVTERTYDGAFIAVGVKPVSGYLENLDLERKDGYVIAGETCETNIKGLYVAGDLRKKPLRQVITAVADGGNAATAAAERIQATRV